MNEFAAREYPVGGLNVPEIVSDYFKQRYGTISRAPVIVNNRNRVIGGVLMFPSGPIAAKALGYHPGSMRSTWLPRSDHPSTSFWYATQGEVEEFAEELRRNKRNDEELYRGVEKFHQEKPDATLRDHLEYEMAWDAAMAAANKPRWVRSLPRKRAKQGPIKPKKKTKAAHTRRGSPLKK